MIQATENNTGQNSTNSNKLDKCLFLKHIFKIFQDILSSPV